MQTLLSHAWRSWKGAPGPALFAVAALMVGIGCATAIFTVVNGVMLKPLPYSDGDRWVVLFGGTTDRNALDQISSLPISDLQVYQAQMRSFEVFGWYAIFGDFNLTSPGAPQHIDGIEVTPSLMGNTGVSPVRGRMFSESDGSDVAVISHRLWTRLGSDSRLVGRQIVLNGRSYTVTGITPAWFRLPIVGVSGVDANNDVWIPVRPPRNETERRSRAIYGAYARLKPGVTVRQARDEAQRVAASIARAEPDSHRNYTASVISVRETVVKEIRPVLLLLFAAAGLLLLITCGNVAGLLVARVASRAHETAVRLALGAGRIQLALQFLFEGLLVALTAAVLAIASSAVLVRMIVSLAADYIPRVDEISLNWPVFFFAVGLAFLTALLSSLAPLWQAGHIQLNEVLSDGVRSSAGMRSRKFSRSLVVAEIALSFTLLVAGALLVSEIQSLKRTWPGFERRHLLTFLMNVSESHQQATHALVTYEQKVLASLERVPGVESAAVANQLPLAGCCLTTSLYAEGQPTTPGSEQVVSFVAASAGYFRTMGIPLRRGRLLNDHDTNENLIAIVIDEAAANRYWPKRDPIGAFAHFGAPAGTRAQVVGIVSNVRNARLGEPTRPEVYLSSALAPPNPANFIVRSNLPPATLIPAVRQAIANVDPLQPLFAVRPMSEIVTGSLSLERINSTVMMIFACAALLMAALGIYGSTSYSVRQRTVEIGTRRAFGATDRDLLGLIVGNGLRMAAAGIFIGGAAVAGATWLVTRYFHVHEISPIPFVLSAVAILTLATFASGLPAWRATLVTPMVAIRNESDSVWATARTSIQQMFGAATEEDAVSSYDAALFTELIEATRHAASVDEALGAALTTVRDKIEATFAVLLETTDAGVFRSVVQIPEESLTGSIPVKGFLVNRLRSYTSPVTFSAGDLESAAGWARERRPQQHAEIDALKQSGVRLALPLRSKTDFIGLLLFGAPRSKKQYNAADKRLLKACAEQFALLIENARLTNRVIEQEKIRRDVALAAEVQKRLLPNQSPETSTIALAAFTLAARTVGGDYYDFFRIEKHRLGIAMADVAGKGVAAALVMAVVRASLRIVADDHIITPPELAAKLNHYLYGSTGANSYATFFYADLDEQKRELRYVNAGHNPPYLVRTGRKIEELTAGGMIIGMFPVARYEQGVVKLASGDVLVVFTDGVTEALNPHDEEFGEDRLKELLTRVADLSVDEIRALISAELLSWMGNAPQHDDLTFIVMKVN
jgi:predicted permease